LAPILLSLGSNIGASELILADAVKALKSILHGVQTSSLYSSDPLYYEDQKPFINMCVTGSFRGEPEELLKEIHIIENAMGRNREAQVHPKGPRPLDIDIILWGNEIINTHQLKIPHYDYQNRAFVLKPALEINPSFQAPESEKNFQDLLSALPNQGVYCLNKKV